MTDINEPVVEPEEPVATEPVVEEPEAERPHVPNPYYQSGQVDTTGLSDAGIKDVSPVFNQARADALGRAVDVLDNDPDAAHEHVVLPDSDRTRDEAEAHLREKAAEAQAAVEGSDPAAPAAAESDAAPEADVVPAEDENDAQQDAQTPPPAV